MIGNMFYILFEQAVLCFPGSVRFSFTTQVQHVPCLVYFLCERQRFVYS